MKKTKFTDAQIAFLLPQADQGTSLKEVCRKAILAVATFYNWRKKYSGVIPSKMKRLKQLDEENTDQEYFAYLWEPVERKMF